MSVKTFIVHINKCLEPFSRTCHNCKYSHASKLFVDLYDIDKQKALRCDCIYNIENTDLLSCQFSIAKY